MYECLKDIISNKNLDTFYTWRSYLQLEFNLLKLKLMEKLPWGYKEPDHQYARFETDAPKSIYSSLKAGDILSEQDL